VAWTFPFIFLLSVRGADPSPARRDLPPQLDAPVERRFDPSKQILGRSLYVIEKTSADLLGDPLRIRPALADRSHRLVEAEEVVAVAGALPQLVDERQGALGIVDEIWDLREDLAPLLPVPCQVENGPHRLVAQPLSRGHGPQTERPVGLDKRRYERVRILHASHQERERLRPAALVTLNGPGPFEYRGLAARAQILGQLLGGQGLAERPVPVAPVRARTVVRAEDPGLLGEVREERLQAPPPGRYPRRGRSRGASEPRFRCREKGRFRVAGGFSPRAGYTPEMRGRPIDRPRPAALWR
jgi:hypothetical protein